MHLTNYAINKDNPNFEQNEDLDNMDLGKIFILKYKLIGHKRTLTSVLQIIEEDGYDVDSLWDEIRDIIGRKFIL